VPLTQTLGTADGTGPVQVGAHLTGPFGAILSHAGGLDTGPGTGVWVDEEATTASLGAWRVLPSTTRLRTKTAGAAIVGLLCDYGAAGTLCTTHGALHSGRPVLIGAVVAGPLHSHLGHHG
jgi:hypothetical protein